MVRILMEDMKLNNRKKQTIIKNDTASSTFSPPPISKKNFYQEETKKEKEVEQIKEEKINEYFKNKNSNRQRIQRTPQIKTRPKILHKPTLIIFIICIIIGGIYWGGNILQKAKITITFKHQIITYDNKQFLASKDLTTNPVDFEIMIVSDTKSKNILLTESKDVSIKATGSVTLYNEFSTTSQKLLAGTFLMDSDGKTYKTDSAVIIPGYSIDNNKKIIPGQIVVNISSFLPGEVYNGAPVDFYINSFKGTTKYNKIYGELKTPLVGGALGFVYVLNDSNKSIVDNFATSSLKENLLTQVKAQVPPGYILYPNALTFSYKTEDNFLSKTPNSDVPIEGVLSVVLLKEKSLTDNIIKISLPSVSGDELKEIKILDLNKLSFNFIDKNQLITKDMSTVSFSLTGNIDAIWNPDIEILKTKLLGINKNDVLPIFRQDKGIASALVKIFPPWQKYIPNNLSKINIIIK